MPTNVTQKDETLHEIIYWCQGVIHGLHWYCETGALPRDYVEDKIDAYEEVIGHCKSMLGYSGTMPDEVENQSEDARQEDADA